MITDTTFNGYLLKFGSGSGARIFPQNLIAAGGYSVTPNQRTEASAYRDANNDLHRVTIDNHKSKIKVTTISGLTLAQKRQIETAMSAGLANSVERKYYIEFWNDDIGVNDYTTGYFYISDVTYNYARIITDEMAESGAIVYDGGITYTFVEY